MATPTRTDWAEERLRTAIVTGELRPGERIRIEQLAADWKLSPTPLREAVRALAQAGLVQLSPQRGASVAGLSAQEITGIYELRLLLEPRALRQSLHRRSWAWRAEVESAWEALQRAWDDEHLVAADIEPVHTSFHQALVSGSPNPELLRMTRRLAAQSIRVLLLAAEQGGPAPTLGEHVALYEVCVDGPLDDAMRVALEHIGRTVVRTMGVDTLREIGDRIAEAGGGDPLLPGVLDELAG